MRRALTLTLFLVFAIGCSEKSAPPPTAMQVGKHHILIQVPEGWEHVNYGDRHQLRKDQARISIEAFRLPNGNLNEDVVDGLKRLGETSQRDEASRTLLDLGGNEAALVDTWDRLSHQWRKRFLFVEAGYDVVAFYTMSGQLETMEPVFNTIMSSFALADSLQPVQ